MHMLFIASTPSTIFWANSSILFFLIVWNFGAYTAIRTILSWFGVVPRQECSLFVAFELIPLCSAFIWDTIDFKRLISVEIPIFLKDHLHLVLRNTQISPSILLPYPSILKGVTYPFLCVKLRLKKEVWIFGFLFNSKFSSLSSHSWLGYIFMFY